LQRLTSLKRTPAGIELTWAGPLRADDGSLHRAGVTMRIRAEGDALRFETHIVNHTPYEVGEVYSPILGGLQGLGSFDFRRRDTELALPAGDRFSASRPFRTFAGMSPFGVLGPEQVYAYPASLRSSWALLRAPRSGRSLYFGAHDPIARAKALHLEMVPGVAGPRGSGNWPRADEIKGRPVGVRIAWTHIVYQSAGRAFDASPVVLRCSQDDPVAAQRYYGKWLDSLGRESVTDASPVARTLGRTPFGDLPGLAADAARAGMQALVLTDWTAGGRNNGVPSFEPDPALGGWSGLRDAARACRGLGVDLILEAAANPVSQRSELYRSALAAFRCVDRWGVPQSVYGWGAPRVTAEALCAGERRVYMNPGHPGFRAWLSEHVARLAEAGLAGIRLTGMFPNLLDFNPTLATTPDRAVCEGSLATLRAVRSAARRHVPGFRVLVPERWDRL
jgi:hypothetical protein